MVERSVLLSKLCTEEALRSCASGSTVCRVCNEGVLWMRVLGCGLRVGLGEAELTRGTAGMLSCSMLLERPPFTSRPTLFRPMEEKKRRRKSFGRPSSFQFHQE